MVPHVWPLTKASDRISAMRLGTDTISIQKIAIHKRQMPTKHEGPCLNAHANKGKTSVTFCRLPCQYELGCPESVRLASQRKTRINGKHNHNLDLLNFIFLPTVLLRLHYADTSHLIGGSLFFREVTVKRPKGYVPRPSLMTRLCYSTERIA
jgi:hypothetical protein